MVVYELRIFMMQTLEFEGLRHFGPDTPVALLRIDGNPRFFDLGGVRDLMEQHRDTDLFSLLSRIERLMLIPGQYPDIQDADFSGQKSLFT